MTTKTGEAYLCLKQSNVVGIGGASTGLGLFTLKEIPPNTFVCAYAPTATLRRNQQDGDYAIELTIGGRRISVNGQENTFEIGLGMFVNDGTFPFSLVPGKFSRQVTERINCEFAKRDSEVWIRSTKAIKAKQELLVQYSHDNSYWNSIFSAEQLERVKHALTQCGSLIHEAEEAICHVEI